MLPAPCLDTANVLSFSRDTVPHTHDFHSMAPRQRPVFEGSMKDTIQPRQVVACGLVVRRKGACAAPTKHKKLGFRTLPFWQACSVFAIRAGLLSA